MSYDARELIEGLLYVVDKETRKTVPFIFNNVQNKYYDAMTDRDDILKARQEGFSTEILALWFVACISEDNTSAVVISHEKDATKRLFARVKFFIDTMKVKPFLKKESETEISFPKTNSNFYIGTAGARAFGHGDTITHLHCSEYSRWKNPDLLTGLLEAVPQSGRVVIETTANGYGDQFHQLWERSQESGVWTPHFYGWTELESNRRKLPIGWKTTVDEKIYARRYNLDSEQICWRRWKIESMQDPKAFPQQHPINDIEAFIRSGTGIFEPTLLQRQYEAKTEYKRGYLEEVEGTIRFQETEDGYLRVYHTPNGEERYAAGVDVMEGIETSGLSESEADIMSKRHDWNVIVIKNRFTWEQMAVYRSQEEPDRLAKNLVLLAKWYSKALVCVENNVGATLLYIMKDTYHYGNMWKSQEDDEMSVRQTQKLGFRTTQKSKKILIDTQEKALRDGSSVLHDRTVIREHLAYMRTPDGKMEAPSGMCDDSVIADALATMVCQRRKYIPDSGNRQRERIGRHAGRQR